MRWTSKAAAFRLFESVPYGHHVYYLAQRHITKSVPSPPARIARHTKHFLYHRANFAASPGELAGKTLFEFGAGWDLCSNIANYCFGIDRQIVVDIYRLARPLAINHVIAYYREHRIAEAVRRPQAPINGPLEQELQDKFGITYLAPHDPSATELPDDSIDFIVSTATLEHIPVDSIRTIMRECHRICKVTSVLSMVIDYSDHYAKADKSISPLNFLRYDDAEWQRYNLKWYYQNRLRHCDYAKIFEESGFAITAQDRQVREADLETARTMTLAPRFRGYRAEDLAATSGRFVLQKKTTEAPALI